MVGCGNSKLSEDMYDVGYKNIVNIDISDVVIKQMNQKNKEKRPAMVFHRMDVTKTSFSDGEFSVVLDKGTLDALMADTSDDVVSTVTKMFHELGRLLRVGGRYICISLLQEHIAQKLFSHFIHEGWPIRVHRVEKTEEQDTSDFALPAFVVILTKFKKMEHMKPILEVCNHQDKMDRHDTLEVLTTVIKEMQYYAIVRQQISKRSVGTEQPSLCLYSRGVTEPRYTLYVVDQMQRSSQKFAVFVVPQGRETDWTFSTPAGRKQLSESAHYQRLVVVMLNREHCYVDIEEVQAELSSKVMELTPPGFRKGTPVPFLSVGDNLGKRHLCAEGSSEITGKYMVEDVEINESRCLRRLIFIAAPNVIQSEARLINNSKKPGKKPRWSFDNTFLPCQHHMAMIGGLALLPTPIDNHVSMLIIGLGGGGLPMFIHHHFHNIKQDVVDFDPEILTIAEKYFYFKQDDRLQVHIADGIDFIHKAERQGKHYDVVMFDVDSKDVSVGISCPPSAFVELGFIKETAGLLTQTGVFILNLVARNEDLKLEILKRLQQVFSSVLVVSVDEEVNEIFYCKRCPTSENSGLPLGGPQGSSAGLAQESSAGFSQGTSLGLSQGSSPIGLSQGTSTGLSQGSSLGLSQGTPTGLSQGASAGLSKGTSLGLAQESSAGLSQGTSAGLAQGSSAGLTQGTSADLIDISESKLLEEQTDISIDDMLNCRDDTLSNEELVYAVQARAICLDKAIKKVSSSTEVEIFEAILKMSVLDL